MTYYIPDHVHFAFDADAVIFMDLKSDQYSMLLGAKARVFQALVTGADRAIHRVIQLSDSQLTEAPGFVDEVIGELLEQRLLTTADADTRTPTLSRIPLPKSNLIAHCEPRQYQVGIREVIRFVSAIVAAKTRLSFSRIENTIRTVERRGRDRRINSPISLSQARRLTCIYNRLRIFVPQDALCLLDSLSLLEFLAKYDCFPCWVFAVRLEPWSAHCWVQYATVTFNQDVDDARTYLPILAV